MQCKKVTLILDQNYQNANGNIKRKQGKLPSLNLSATKLLRNFSHDIKISRVS